MAASEFDQVVEQQHTALDAFARGDDKPLAALWSKADDVTLGNPFGPFVSGFPQVAETMEAAAANYREGAASGFDLIAKHVGDDVAYLVEVLQARVVIGTNVGDAVVDQVHRSGLQPETVLVRRSTLEDVFLRLTGRSLVD